MPTPRLRPSLRPFASFALASLLILSSAAHATPWLGAIGDSLTEPYGEVDPTLFESFLRSAQPGWPFLGTPAVASPTPLNWVEQIQLHRASELTAENFGLGGTDTHTLLDQNQHTAAAAAAATQAGLGNTTYASIGIGTNNFLPFGFPGQINTYFGIQTNCVSLTDCPTPFTGSNGLAYNGVDIYLNDIMAEFGTALSVLQSTGAQAVVMGPGSWSSFPNVALGGVLSPNAIIDEAVDLLIAAQRAEALAQGLPFVDFQAMLEDFPTLTVGGLAMLAGSPPIGTRDPRHWFLPDGIHPDTIASGLLANAMMTALNDAYGAGLTLFSDAEILGFAGLTPDAGWNGVSVDVSGYVTVPEPGMILLLLASAGVVAARRNRPSA